MFHFPFCLLCRRSFHRRHFHSTTTQPLQLPLSFPIYLIWGSNTAVGKTLVSAGVAASQLLSSPTLFHYVKPVQTGFPIDSDSRFVFNKVSALFLRRNPSFSLFASNLILNASGPASNAAGETEGCGMEMSVLNWREENKLMGEKNGCLELICKTMYAWEEAVSPHLAVERESATVKYSVVLETLQRCFRDVLEGGADKGESEVLCACCITHSAVTMVILSGKGGWCRHSSILIFMCNFLLNQIFPSLSVRPFRIPAILVGDGQLGGISGTISAYESLTLRGYDVVAIVLEDHGLLNEVSLMSYTRNK